MIFSYMVYTAFSYDITAKMRALRVHIVYLHTICTCFLIVAAIFNRYDTSK
jgi:hypothetical protein